MDFGSCGLHVVHGSMKAGAKASKWELQKLLKPMWKFIHDAPARRAMFENISESTDYPVNFCGHRWCENEKYAENAESLIKGYQRFVTHVFFLRRKQQPDSKNKSFIVLKKMIHDPLISAKIKFFEMVSHKFSAFVLMLSYFKWLPLGYFDSPMVPFFADVPGGIVRDFLKLVKLRKTTNLYQLVQIDPSDKNIRKSAEMSILVLLPTSKLKNLILTQM